MVVLGSSVMGSKVGLCGIHRAVLLCLFVERLYVGLVWVMGVVDFVVIVLLWVCLEIFVAVKGVWDFAGMWFGVEGRGVGGQLI